MVRSIVGCATRWVELAGAEGCGDRDDRENRIVDGLWGVCGLGLVESKRKACPEEEIQLICVVDAVRQGLQDTW